MDSTTRTIYAAHLATCLLLKRPFTIPPNSTLNQKFNVAASEVPGALEYPSLGYIGIGNKGMGYDITPNNFVLTTPYPQVPKHASLYNHIPFIVRPVESDLSSTERLKYRMRVVTSINNTLYAVYYLKALPMSTVTPALELRNVQGRNITTSVFTPVQGDLSPTPPNISNTNLNSADGDYLVVTAKCPFYLDATEVTEIMDACTLLYGDARYAVINEVAICTGLDRVVQGNFGNTNSNYIESIATQIASFASVEHRLSESTTEVRLDLDVGSVLPLLV